MGATRLSTTYEDTRQATDLVTDVLGGFTWGVRVRSAKFKEDYGNEFTIRAKSAGGGKTELDKILDGWCDFFFYGFASEDESRITKWSVGALEAFRRAIKANPSLINSYNYRDNGDGTGLRFWNWSTIPGFKIASDFDPLAFKGPQPKKKALTLFDMGGVA